MRKEVHELVELNSFEAGKRIILIPSFGKGFEEFKIKRQK